MGNKIFTVEQVKATNLYGFKWRPGIAIDFDPLPANTPGILIVFTNNELEQPKTFFGNPTYNQTPIFAVPDKLHADLVQLATTIDEANKRDNNPTQYGKDVKTLALIQGYMTYTNNCLNYVYRSPTGKKLLDRLTAINNKTVAITPSGASNQIIGASAANSMPPLVTKLLDSDIVFGDPDGLIQLAHARFQRESEDASLNAMAEAMNFLPLYSLFKSPPYELTDEGFLLTYFSVKGSDLKAWFKGTNSLFVNKMKYSTSTQLGVKLTNYVRIASVILLRNQFPKGTGSVVTINFSVVYEAGLLDQSRPPAIGLAHELIHALWAMSGEQLGKDFGAYSTLLFELKCVGLGPWRDAEISENKIRAEWAAVRNALTMDAYNDKAVVNRDVYELANPDSQLGRIQFRNQFGAI